VKTGYKANFSVAEISRS